MDSETKRGQAEKLAQARRQIVANLVIFLQADNVEAFTRAIISCFEAYDIQISQADIVSNQAKWEKLHQAWHERTLPRIVTDIELETEHGYGNFLVYTVRDDSAVVFNITAGPCSNPNPTMHIYEDKRILFPGFFQAFSKDIAAPNSFIKFNVNNKGKYTISEQLY